MLPQKPDRRGHKLRLRKLVAVSSLPLLSVVTAFGFMPQSATAPEQPRTVVQDVTLPKPQPAIGIASSSFWHNERVQRGDTVAELLRRLEIEDNAAGDYLLHDPSAESFRSLGVGRPLLAEIGSDGTLLGLRYLANSGEQMLIEKRGAAFVTRTLPSQPEQRIFMRSGEIKTTLYAAIDEASLPDPAANQLADIFGGDLDFHHDLAPGDRFTVIYEMTYSNGEPVRAGRILAAEIVNRGKSHRAVYFQTDGNHGSYYTPDGKNLHRAFLRSPVEFSRISSGFTSARFHPILNKWQAHRGVDFAAPLGTKVKATATGTIVFVGRQTGYGNLIVVQHEGRFSTAYGHLSRFARSLHVGQHVSQGEVIGYVGKSGWATGPHLHYEFRVDGKQRNPLRVAMPDVVPIGEDQKADFQAATRDLSARLSLLRDTSLAQLD